MKSATLFTEEIDDLDYAVQELRDQLAERLTLKKNTCGILFCDIDTDISELMKALKAEFSFPIIGTTAVALLSKDEGYNDIGITMLVMTDDECEFFAGVTEELTEENYRDEIGKLYSQLEAYTSEKEKLIIAFGPQHKRIIGDDFVKLLTELSGGIPVVGGIASDRFTLVDNKVFCNEKISHMRLALMLITGKIKPIFNQEFSVADTTEALHTVVRSEGNVVYELDDCSMLESLRRAGLNLSKGDGYVELIGTAFEAVLDLGDGQKISVMRDMGDVDPDHNSAVFLGNVPEGSKMRLCILNKEAIKVSVRKAFTRVLDEIKTEKDYEYSTFLCISCAGRFLLLASDPDAEGKAYGGLLPDNITLCGMYSYGEFCPVYGDNEKLYNVFHNKTFTLVAF